LTTRQLFDLHAANPGCSSCHELIDPIGDGFEHFDGIGAYRATDNNQPVDDSGQVTATEDANGTFAGVPALTELLANSREVDECFARKFFRYGSGQSDPLTEQEFINELGGESPAGIQDLIISLVRSKAFGQRAIVQ
jgi:hypothetical protein